jgi:hypothetical protein
MLSTFSSGHARDAQLVEQAVGVCNMAHQAGQLTVVVYFGLQTPSTYVQLESLRRVKIFRAAVVVQIAGQSNRAIPPVWNIADQFSSRLDAGFQDRIRSGHDETGNWNSN